jgi:hypothetical protein
MAEYLATGWLTVSGLAIETDKTVKYCTDRNVAGNLKETEVTVLKKEGKLKNRERLYV